MIRNRVTYRTVDGVRIPGTWRHVFVRNGRYFLTDLRIYADGLVDCWGLVTLEEFEEKLRSGWVATDLPDGAPAAAHGVARWKLSEPRSQLTPELLLAEVKDTIDQLNDRPDSTGRCLAAVDAFLEDRTEQKRAVAREAFLAIPVTKRRFALSDMDRKDWPLRVLVAGPGGRTYLSVDEPVTQEDYDRALAYFEERSHLKADWQTSTSADGPATPYAPAVYLPPFAAKERVMDPGLCGLRNDYPAPITVGEVDYPSVAHAYWALSLARPEDHDSVARADSGAAAQEIAAGAPRREGWEQARTAVMTCLLRAKYSQHSELAEILLATNDSTLLYEDGYSSFWGESGGRGRNWLGRLLELVRSDLHMRRSGIPVL
ncbi:NADAR family protein [Streptomyces sp. JL7001]|uniref:NADAR family protein n=1 Tax=Streptomyces sp. JL7001 TaxID=3445784 RepID=UPI003F79BCBD